MELCNPENLRSQTRAVTFPPRGRCDNGYKPRACQLSFHWGEPEAPESSAVPWQSKEEQVPRASRWSRAGAEDKEQVQIAAGRNILKD